MNQFFSLVFFVHDTASSFLAKHLFAIKRLILIAAHLALFGFFFPDLRKDFGEMAANLLIVILFLSPLSKIFRTRLLLQLMGLRREMGIMMGYLATVHGLGYVLDPQWFDLLVAPALARGLFFVDPALLVGGTAYLLTLPLLLTSNTWAQRTLGGARWKLLHRLVYLMFVFAIVHRYFMKGGLTGDMIEAVLLLSGYIIVKVLAWRNFLSPLEKSIAWVALRYQEYTALRMKQSILAPPSQIPL